MSPFHRTVHAVALGAPPLSEAMHVHATELSMSSGSAESQIGTHCPGVEVPDVDGVVFRAADDPLSFLVRRTKAGKDAVLAVDVACAHSHRYRAAW